MKTSLGIIDETSRYISVIPFQIVKIIRKYYRSCVGSYSPLDVASVGIN